MVALLGALSAGASIAGCGVLMTSSEVLTPKNDSGYRVLAGAVPGPLLGTGRSATPLEQSGSNRPAVSPDVPSALGQWFMTSSTTGLFRRSEKVELLATGHRGERFNLYWQESCGGTRFGKHGVLGGSGGEAVLTLQAPALVLVRLPSRSGSYNMCYLAATVSMHMRNWKAAKAAAPAVKIIHY